MLGVFLELLKALLPFFKESMLGGGSFKQWVRDNIAICIWFILVLTMLGIVFYLGDALTYYKTEYEKTKAQVTSLEQEKKSLNEKVTTLTAENAVLSDNLAEVTGERDKYKSWLTNCQVDVNYVGEGMPACPVKKVTVTRTIREKTRPRRTTPKPEVPAERPAEPEKKSIFSKIKSIFSGNEE